MKVLRRITTLNIISFFLLNSIYAQDSLTLIGRLNYTGIPIHDINYYVDTTTGIPYALLCASTSGMRVINISNPYNPFQTGTISGGGVNVVDVGTFKNYAYTVAENISSTSGRIIDLSNPSAPVQVGIFQGGHTVNVTKNGYMYIESPGIKIYNLNPNPLSPQLVYNDPSCIGHDVTIVGNRLYDFSNNCGTKIYDLSQPDTLVLLGSIPSLGIFHHSGYPTVDGNFLLLGDELSSPTKNDITIWDISNPASPIVVDSFLDANAYVHNFQIVNNYAYVSFYRAGLRVFDVSNPYNISLVDEYDTDSLLSGPGYGGSYGVYVDEQQGIILTSDENKGLYIFKFSALIAGVNSYVKNEIILSEIYPNPSSGNFNLKYFLLEESDITISVCNSLGEIIYKSQFGKKITGSHIEQIRYDFQSGFYVLNIISKKSTTTIKFIVNK